MLDKLLRITNYSHIYYIKYLPIIYYLFTLLVDTKSYLLDENENKQLVFVHEIC